MAVVHASGVSKLYVNGHEVTYSIQSPGTGTMTTYTNTGFILGDGNNGGQKYFSGKMDNVMIFTKALTPAQVYALYKTQTGNMIDHDAAGNLVADKDGYLYDYDGENRIVRISKGNGTTTPTTVAEFVYDALGRRIYAYDAIAGAGRYFCYNNAWQVLEEYDTAGSFAWANVFGNYIDEVLVRSATSSKYYYAHNHLYSPVAVMDFTAGTVLERYDYDAYGTTHIMDASYTARTASAVGNPYTFTGRELDTLDSGNLKTMHYRARNYDPFTGRFDQQDSLGVMTEIRAQSSQHHQYLRGLSLYEYTRSQPLINLDPTGYLPNEIVGGSSSCDLHSGKFNIKKDPRLHYCQQAATDAHEEMHRNQQSSCCELASRCVQHFGEFSCLIAWGTWLRNNEDAFECQAYTASADKFQEIREGFGNDGKGNPPAPVCDPEACRQVAKDEEAHDRGYALYHCPRAKLVTDCPFSDYGFPLY